MNSRINLTRLKFVSVVLCLSLISLWCRLFFLQAVECARFKGLASTQHTLTVAIPAERGKIYDRSGSILALSVPGTSVFASPSEMEIDDVPSVALGLSSALNLEARALRAKLHRAKLQERPRCHFVWVKRLVTPEEEAGVRALRLEGVHMREESRRFYPFGKTLAHLIGFAGVDQQGLAGVESAFDEDLRGTDGYRSQRRDGLRRTISSPLLAFKPAAGGRHLVLTVDTNVQDFLEAALKRCYGAHRPKAVTGVVMDPNNGDVLALAQLPAFDPAAYADYPRESWRLQAVTDSFEPGSMFKPFVFAGALEEGIVRLDETIFCENGAYRIGGRLLHDHHAYGHLSARNVIVKSSNIGMAKIGQRLGPTACHGYLSAFGFGRRSGLGLAGEAPGYLPPVRQWSHYTLTSVPMGHEVAVNAIQMVSAFSVFANGGYLVQPRILRGILGPDGATLEKHLEPVVKRRVLSEATAHTMLRDVLAEVVASGTGRLANLEPLYRVAGKTGTAQKLVDGRYSHDKYISSFICTGPVEEPRAVVLIVVDEPSTGPGRFGGSAAAPYAAEVLKATLDYIYIDTRRRAAEMTYASANVPRRNRTGSRGSPDAP